MQIDAHQHFWIYNEERDSWINDDMAVIKKDFLPTDLKVLLQENGIDGCVVVQSDQSEEENEFQLKNADETDFIKGVVGWVDLQAVDVEERLEYHKSFKKMKGFRHVLQGELQRDLMLTKHFKRGINCLSRYGFTYDILIFPDQLSYSTQLVAAFANQKFVVDHLAKPYIKSQKIEEWKEDIKAIAQHENTWCKLSGFVTEADWKSWSKDDFVPYFDAVVESFGTKRIMFGSDWPVCLVAARYEEVLAIVKDYFSTYSVDEQKDIFGNNAIEFYNL